ncbi:hypothetical protein ABEP16_13130 [Priestia aryabhattai]|uniref:hypothetical protein n=1 Tax=Priestia aryabhattai TaxID=412384 RepID=UPI003D2D9170
MMSFDEFIEKCKRKGLDPFFYLIPEDKFREIDDKTEYSTEDVAYLIDKSSRQARRWLSSGYIKPFNKRPYKCYGIEIKRALFMEFYNQIINRFEGRGKGS